MSTIQFRLLPVATAVSLAIAATSSVAVAEEQNSKEDVAAIARDTAVATGNNRN